jgi:hypothetical protein
MMTEVALHFPGITSIKEIDRLDVELPEVNLETEIEQFGYCPELWVKRLYKVVKRFGDVSRIYFGNEFCERLIPSLDEVKQAMDVAAARKWKFTLVTPYVTNKGIRKLRALFEYLGGVTVPGGIEVIVNDPGVIELVSGYKTLEPVLGRLKDPMKRMARFVNQMPSLTPAQESALASSNITIEAYQKFLLSMGFRRVEFDLVPQGIDINFVTVPFKASFYYPWTYLTVGRICEMGSLNLEDKDKFTLYNSCQKECQKYYASWATEWPGASNKIFSFGNAVFMLCEAPRQVLEKYITQDFDRIVYQPVLPV